MKTRKLIFSVLLAGVILPLHSQNWLPLDNGIGKDFAAVNHILTDSNFLYVSGNFTEDGNNISMRGIAKWNGNKWDSVGDANKFNATKQGIYKFHDTLMTSCIFYDWPYESFAKLNNNTWEPYNNSRDLDVNCFLENNGILYLGGWFNKCGNDSTYLLGKYDGITFSGMTPLYSTYTPGYVIECMAFFQDTLYVGGSFYLYPQMPIAGFAKWNGNNLLPVSSEFLNSACTIESMTVYQNELYIGGYFTKSTGFTGDYIMKWDGHQFSEVGGGTDQRVTCLKVYNNELYVGGYFSQVGGMPCQNIAKWNGSQWTCLNNDVFDEFYSIKDLCIYKDELYVAGYFRKIGNDSINSVAKYNHSLLALNDISDAGNHLLVYPNPISTSSTLQLSKPLQNATLSIYDVLGKEVKTLQNLNGTEIKINREEMKSGMYFFRLEDKEGFVGNGKMIVE